MRQGDGLYERGKGKMKTWYLGCTINGTRYQKRLGKGITRSIALDLSLKHRVEILSGNAGYGRQPKDVTFDAGRTEFQKWADANKKPGTAGHYDDCLRQLDRSFSGKKLSQISSFAVEGYKQARVNAGARVCVNRELAVLKSLFNRCKEWKLYEGPNPVKSVKKLPEPRRRLRFLEPDEEVRLLAACQEPLRSLILLGIHTGLRIHAEALQLRWEDIDLRRGSLTVQAAYAKNGRTRTVPLNSIVLAALEQLQRTATGDRVFTCGRIGEKFRTACATAKLTGVVPHSLRHTFATRLVENGVDLRTVQELGGWSDLTLVQRYTHVSPSRKAEAVEGLVRQSATLFPTPEIRRIGETA